MRKTILCMSLALLFLFGCSTPTDHDVSDDVYTSGLSTEPASEINTVPNTEMHTESPTESIISFDTDPGMYLETYTDESTSDYLDYYLFVPENADFNMPLVVFLHGDGEVLNPRNLENYGPVKAAKMIYGEDFPFIALYPCTRVYSWVDEPIPQTLMGLIKSISERMASDPERIILTGHSRGSSGVWNMLSLYGDYFSAAVPISCGPSTKLQYETVSKVPIKAVAGTIGEYEINYGKAMRKTVDKLIEFGGCAEMIYMDNLDHSGTSFGAFTDTMFDWMFSQ